MEFVFFDEYVLKCLNETEKITKIKDEYLSLLSELTVVSNITNDEFLSAIFKICGMGKIIIGLLDETIICSGTIIIEPKIIRGCKSVGHIEDIVVIETHRGQGIAQELLAKLKDYGFKNDCYKIILDCDENLEEVYNKSGFEYKGIQMGIYKEKENTQTRCCFYTTEYFK